MLLPNKTQLVFGNSDLLSRFSFFSQPQRPIALFITIIDSIIRWGNVWSYWTIIWSIHCDVFSLRRLGWSRFSRVGISWCTSVRHEWRFLVDWIWTFFWCLQTNEITWCFYIFWSWPWWFFMTICRRYCRCTAFLHRRLALAGLTLPILIRVCQELS